MSWELFVENLTRHSEAQLALGGSVAFWIFASVFLFAVIESIASS